MANLGALAFPPAVGFALDVSGSFVAGFGALAVLGVVGAGVLAVGLPRPRLRRAFVEA